MMEGINISLAEVSRVAASIRTINENLKNKLHEMKKEVDGLASSWQSDAAETIRSRMNAFAPRFEEHYKVVESYATFLDHTVTAYDTTETTLNNNASMFK